MFSANVNQWTVDDGFPDEAPIHGYVQATGINPAKDPLGIIRGAGEVRLARGKKSERTCQLYSYKRLKSYPFIEYRDYIISSGLIVVDIDEPDAEMRIAYAINDGLIPPPSYYIVNDKNGHAQAAWHYGNFYREIKNVEDLTEEEYIRFSKRLPKQEFLIRQLKVSLTGVLHGDNCFTQTRFRNPYCTSYHRVMLPSNSVIAENYNGSQLIVSQLYVYNLKAMADFMDNAGSFNDGQSAWHSRNLVNHVIQAAGCDDVISGMNTVVDPNAVVYEGMRNNTVFAVAVHAARLGEDVDKAAHSVHCSPRLSSSEMKHIIKSAKKTAGKPLKNMIGTASTVSNGSKGSSSSVKRYSILPDSVRNTLVDLGRKGGNANTDKQCETRRKNLDRGRLSSMRTRVANRDKVIWDLRKAGSTALKVLKAGGVMRVASLKRIAERNGMSLATVRRCIADIVRMLKAGWSEMLSSNSIDHDKYASVYNDAYEITKRFGRKAGIATLLECTVGTPFALWSFNDGKCLSLWYDDKSDAISRLMTVAA